MLKLNVNEKKQLNFEMEIGGVQTDDIVSFLRIKIDNIEYGFPAEIKQESVSVDIPALKNVIAGKLKEGQEVKVKLDVIADGHLITPWNETFILTYPFVVEAKMVDKETKISPKFATKLVSSATSKIVKEEKKSEKEITQEVFKRFAAKIRSKQKITPLKEEKIVKPIGKVKPKIDIKNITEEDVYKYMTRAGTKTPHIQKLVYEQAVGAAGSGKPWKVLQQVIKVLKKHK